MVLYSIKTDIYAQTSGGVRNAVKRSMTMQVMSERSPHF
jgi:hypothetical protein